LNRNLPRRPAAARCALLVALAGTILFAPRAHATPVVPGQFVVEDIAPGANFDTPTSIAPLPDGRILVAEKRGHVWMVKNGVKLPNPVWAHDSEVLNSYDRGLLCVTVDPHFYQNHYVYLLYTVDPDSDNVEDQLDAFGRLSRFTMSTADTNVIDTTTRVVLMGDTWSHGPLIATGSHTIASLRWGTDGSLLMSVGDGADFTVGPDAGGLYPQDFVPGRTNPAEDIGSYRSQYIKSLCGKVLRINPADGHGYPSNPFYNGDPTAPQSKVWAYGFRNPFRFCVRPGSGATDPGAGNPGAIYIGDVGWNDWEEMDVFTGGGHNFGWPCWEGPVQQAEYWPLAPSHLGCDSIGVVPDDPSPVTTPAADWHHRLDYAGNPPGFLGNCSIGGVFYSDTLYPAQYRGKYFHGDYGQNWVRVATMSPTNQLLSFDAFGSNMDGPVDFQLEPGTGNILYVAILANQVRRIRYTGPIGGDTPPVAIGSATPTVGPAPLQVQFNDSNSYDADGDSLAITWIFGDGSGTTQRNPEHTYAQAGDYQALLIVDDGRQGESRDTVVVLVSPLTTFPSAPVIDNFNRADGPLSSPWTADVGGLGVSGNRLVQTSGYGFPIYDQIFGPDQEAYITFSTITGSAAPERDLVLKAQGTNDAVAHIEVRYDATLNQVDVGTYDPANGWLVQGTPIPATFAAGDRFGARAYANGQVEVYQNATRIGVRNLTGWPQTQSGGRIGLTLDAANKGSFDDFGGGDVVFAVNHPPTAHITSPVDSTFYVVPETILLRGTKGDVEDSLSQLQVHWGVILHHNNHVHIALEFDGDSAQFATIDHDDGTGVYYEVKMVVTDSGGMRSDTMHVAVFPEADLEPSAITTDAGTLGAGVPTQFSFEMRNHGHLLAHTSHWQLLMDNLTLAQGDTLVLPLDSTLVSFTVPANTFSSGMHTLRAVLDTLNSVVETNENNNVVVQSLAVPGGSTAVGSGLPTVLALSQGLPNPSHGEVRFALDLPQSGDVSFQILDIQGREVLNQTPRTMGAGRWSLHWDGRIGGAPAPPGLYLARVRVGGRVMIRRLALLR